MKYIILGLSLVLTSTACLAETAQSATATAVAQAADTAHEMADPAFTRQAPFVKRPFIAEHGGQWFGNAICYGPHRDGQHPDGESPTREQLLEDLQIMSRHWNMIRMYGSVGSTKDVLELIQEHDIPIKVVVGAWIATEAQVDEAGNITERFPDTVASNREQVEAAVELANTFPRFVSAITIGNESQVEWSGHKVRPEVLINYIRQARAQTTVPVSTADVSTFWAKPHSKRIADELDFIVTHIYAMWNGQQLTNAMAWTKDQYAQNLQRHPDHAFVIGEAGWATTRLQEGDQANYIKGIANEDNQRTFHRDYTAWTTENRIPNFFFEAFDENWKGGEHPDEVEKHWGLFNADRTPKKALADGPE